MDRHRIRRKHGNTHISLAAIKQYLLHGTYPSGSTPSDKRSVRKRAESFKIEDGELYYIIRPKRIEGEPIDPNPGACRTNLRQAILTQKAQLTVASSVHVQNGGNHMGTERTLSALSSKYYWVGMANTVRKVVKNCVICLSNRPAVATLPPTPHQAVTFSQGNELEAVMPVPTNFTPNKKDIYTEAQTTARSDEGPGEIQYIVTAELEEPEEVDADLDFVKVIQNENGAIIDPVFNSRSDFDAAKKFWQKVEVLVLGSFPCRKKRSAYVIASMDSFSKWPEVHIINKINEKTVSQFCLKLIARYGIMEQLILLENEAYAEEPLDAGGICQNLQAYSVVVSKESFSVTDENWSLLVGNIMRFVRDYKDSWFDCLDLCLIPLRNSLTQATDFTPSYLLMGREPVFPDSIIQGKDSTDAEVALSQEQIEQSIDSAMDHYLHCSVPDIKQIILPEGIVESVYEIPASRSPVRKSARKTKKYHRLAGFDGDDDDDEEDNVDVIIADKNTQSAPNDDFSTATKRRKLVGSSVLYKKTTEDDTVTKQDVKEERKGNPECLNKSKDQDNGDEVLEKIDLDTYYRIVSLYKLDGSYPANNDPIFKRTVRKVCESFILEKGQLMYNLKGKLKKVPVTLKERLALMKDAHITKNGHMSRIKTLETIESQSIFWKGMYMDIQAFVGACSDCKHGEPRRRPRASKRALRWFRGVEDDEDSDEETNGDIGKVLYEELVDYLRKDIIPDGLTRSELLVFKKRAKNFKLVKGALYFCPAKKQDLKPRKVLRTERERQDALKDVHGEQHAGHAAMKDLLRKHFFWQGMADDVERFIVSCCQFKLTADGNADDDGERRNPLLEAKIKVFQDYFAGKNVCPKEEPLDLLFPKKEEVASPFRDLVAVAMESARLTTNNMSTDATPAQEVLQNVETFTSAVSAQGGELMSSVDLDQTVITQPMPELSPLNSKQDEEKSRQNKTNGPRQDAGCKEELSDYEGDDNEDIDGENIIEGMNDEEERDETWKPSSVGAVKPALLQVSESSKKSSIRRRCEVCQQVIRGDNNFKEHMYKHTRIKPFSCGSCEKKFTSFKGLKMHSRRHTGHRPYLCNICGRGFPRSASLRYHIKTHDKGGGVPVCDVCNRIFSTENRMQKHKRFKHPVQVPVHKCVQCDKIFTAKRSLKRHEEAHQGIRKYECQYCKRSFFRKEYLNYHLVSHSSEDPSLANYKMKSKLRKASVMKRREFGTTGLSIVCLESSGEPVPQDQEVYGQLVEVTGPHEWTEGERAMVYEINSDQRTGDGTVQHITEDGTTVVVMEGQPDDQGALEVRHIIVPSDHLQQHHKQAKQITIHQQHLQHHREISQPQSIEVNLPTGIHTFTLPSGGQLRATEADHDTVQYQVECLPGETLTEDDFNAIRVLAQASLGGSHLLQQ